MKQSLVKTIFKLKAVFERQIFLMRHLDTAYNFAQVSFVATSLFLWSAYCWRKGVLGEGL